MGLVFCGGKEDKNDLASTNMSREEARPDKALYGLVCFSSAGCHGPPRFSSKKERRGNHFTRVGEDTKSC